MYRESRLRCGLLLYLKLAVNYSKIHLKIIHAIVC